MACFGEPYHLHVCPKCQGVWECPDDVAGICRVKHICASARPEDDSGANSESTANSDDNACRLLPHHDAESVNLWEILVPVANNEGVPFSEDHHERFRRILRASPGNKGTTTRPPGNGDWEVQNRG